MFTMKKIIPVLLILAYVLSACAPAAFTETKAGGEMTPVETEASPEVQNEPTTAGTAPPVPASIADRPRGIFVLTDLSVGKDSAQKTSKQLDQVIQLDYVTGVTLRVLWGKTETSRGQYDFSAVDDALSVLQTTDKKLNFDGSPYAGFQQP